jgi:hypothetical protein
MEIQWHDAVTWRTFAGTFEDFSFAVTIVDCTPIRINVLSGMNLGASIILYRTLIKKRRQRQALIKLLHSAKAFLHLSCNIWGNIFSSPRPPLPTLATTSR